ATGVPGRIAAPGFPGFRIAAVHRRRDRRISRIYLAAGPPGTGGGGDAPRAGTAPRMGRRGAGPCARARKTAPGADRTAQDALVGRGSDDPRTAARAGPF